MKSKTHELYVLEQLAGGHTWIHRIHPTVKLFTTAVFIITIASFDRYAIGRLIPYIFYPLLLMVISETPYPVLMKRFLLALPFCFFAGISNIIFDRAPAFTICGIAVSYGVISFFTILFRTYLCVMGVLLFVSVTPLAEITLSMRRLRVPYIFVVIFEMTYRYIGILFEEAHSMYIAYSLRSTGSRGIKMRDMGSFAGQLLLRSFDRAERVYHAMKCRGYALQTLPKNGRPAEQKDWLYLFSVCFLCIVFRFTDINASFGKLLGGFFHAQNK